MHPDRNHPGPSRHVPLDDSGALDDAVQQLYAANACGWGSFVAIGLRRPKLGRWRRGGIADVAALPALFVDLDNPAPETLHRLRAFQPAPSCIVFSGGGFHAYWWLQDPPTKVGSLSQVPPLLHGLEAKLGGDPLSIAHSLRLPGTVNTKPERGGACCRLVELRDEGYALSDFQSLLIGQTPAPTSPLPTIYPSLTHPSLNAELLAAVASRFVQQGYRRRGDWLNGRCIYPGGTGTATAIPHSASTRAPATGFATFAVRYYSKMCAPR